MADKFSVSILFGLIDGITKPLTNIGKRIGGLGGYASTATRGLRNIAVMADQVSPKLSSLGKSLSLKLTAPIVGMGALSFKASNDFNAAMANVATLIPGNIKRVESLKRSVMDLSVETGKGTLDMADGLYQVISAFGDSAISMDKLRISARAAKAGISTTTDAINLLSAVTKGYGDTSIEATEKAADLAFQTVKLGQTTFPELAASIGRVTPLAAQLGVSQEELFAGFATLTGVTGGAAEVSTQLSAILAGMLKPTDLLSKVVKHLGYETAGAMVKQLGFSKTLQELTRIAGGSEEAFTEMLGGRKEGLIASFAIAGKQADDFKMKMEAMRNSANALNDAYKEQTEGINKAGASWNKFMSQLSVFRIEIGDKLAPILSGFLSNYIVPLMEKFSGMSEGGKKITLALAGIVAIVPPLLVALGSIGAAVAGIMLVSAPIWGTITLVTLAVTALASAGVFLATKWGAVKDLFKGLKEQLLDYLNTIMGFVGKIKGFGVGILKKIGLGDFFGVGEATPVFGSKEYGRLPLPAAGPASKADVNIRLIADPGTEAKVDKIKRTQGNVNLNLATQAYVGSTM